MEAEAAQGSKTIVAPKKKAVKKMDTDDLLNAGLAPAKKKGTKKK